MVRRTAKRAAASATRNSERARLPLADTVQRPETASGDLIVSGGGGGGRVSVRITTSSSVSAGTLRLLARLDTHVTLPTYHHPATTDALGHHHECKTFAPPRSLGTSASVPNPNRNHKVCSLFCSLAVLDLRAGHTMDVLSPFISVLCHSD